MTMAEEDRADGTRERESPFRVLFLLFLSIPAAVVVELIALGLVLVAAGGRDPEGWRDDFIVTPGGIVVTLLPVPLLLGLFAWIGIRRTRPGPWGFGRPRGSLRAQTLLLLACPALLHLGMAAAGVVQPEPSDGVRTLMRVATCPSGATGLLAVLGAALVPALGWGAFHRGFVQPRLTAALSAAGAIALTTAGFVLLLPDLQSRVMVLPLAVWLGFVSHTTRSAWPAIAGHALANLAWFLELRWRFAAGESASVPADGLAPPRLVLELIVVGVAVWLALRRPSGAR